MGRCHAVTASLGEDTAARFLAGRGYRILSRNERTSFGEIDIVARIGRTIIFVEVKARTSEAFGPPSLAITKNKMERIIRNSCSYMKTNGLAHRRWRIDVVTVLFGSGSQCPEILLFKNVGEHPYV